MISSAGCTHLLRNLAVARGARKLMHRLAVPVDAQPGKPVKNGIDCRLGGTLAVGVLDPQQHATAASARVKPVEQRRARPPDMEETGRRRSEAGDNRFGHGWPDARASGLSFAG